MKTPIEPGDIKAGDLIRWESEDGEEAHESRIGDLHATGFSPGKHFLLDRPKPSVELPTEPTLGWLSQGRGGFFGGYIADPTLVTAWLNNDGSALLRADTTEGIPLERVHAFTPATGVPTKALMDLRREVVRDETDRANGWGAAERLRRLIDTFLAAVDKANGASR